MQKTAIWGLFLAMAAAVPALAQPDAKFYKLDYVVKELEAGKVVNSRSYSTMAQVSVPGGERNSASIRAGGRVPVASTNGTQFFETGVNIDSSSLREQQGDISVNIQADVTTIAQDGGSGGIPVTRQNQWRGTVIVPLKKATVVFASDDVSSKRQLQLELTATPVAVSK